MTAILGISAFYHDSAAALVVDGDIVAAAQEERFSRVKNDARFPVCAIEYALAEGGLGPDKIDYVVFYDKPFTKFERLLETYLAYAPAGWNSFRMAMPRWLKDKLFMRRKIRAGLDGAGNAPILFLDHHESHAASAFFPSPFDEAAILTLDGVGEWSTTTIGTGQGNQLRLTQRLDFPHSLGLLYSAFTYYCGFKVNHGEYKLMGLAPYGNPCYVDLICRHLIDIKSDGSYWLNMKYFNYCQGLTMTNRRFDRLFGGAPRKPDGELTQRHMDLAASVQRVTEEVMMRIARALHRQTSQKNLVMAGGVALNCVANGKLLRDGPFENLWVQPAAGDSGGALGAALFVWHQLLEKQRRPSLPDAQQGSFLGPSYGAAEVEQFLDRVNARYHRYTDEKELLDRAVAALSEEKIVGWFNGRTEFGPRALGARSILADPRSVRMQATLNLKTKFRESFRPFAPCCLREHVHEWFETRPEEDSPYMLLVAPVRRAHRVELSQQDQQRMHEDPDLLRRVNIPRSTVPAVTHVDYSARVQTVDERHDRFYRLLKAFHAKTGCPILINTSFNLSWEPIVLSPQHAYHTFMQSQMDVLVLGDFVLYKEEQPLGQRFWVGPRAEQAPADSPWADPVTGEPLLVTADCALNPANGTRYPVQDGIPRLFVPTASDGRAVQDVTDLVKQFYEKTPFPNYEDLDDQRALLDKARASVFARLLQEQIPYDARVVEVGCGTGQLSNFLAIAHRSVLGVDLCANSLRLAHEFKCANGLDRVAFAQMNLFRPALRQGFFDVVISNGVLHHTSDAKSAYQTISRLAKPGGLVIVGLYNAFSRKLHYARRALYRWTGVRGRWLDPHFAKIGAKAKYDAWFKDQYCHPHETCHTLDEVLGWMDEAGLEFVNSIPKPVPGAGLGDEENLFETRDCGNRMTRILSQVASMNSGYREGGFFIVIGRRRQATQSGVAA